MMDDLFFLMSIDRDPLAALADVIPQPIFGPSLTIGGHSAQWTGSTTSDLGQVGMACRVTCEANVGERTISRLHICNDGTTAIYYSWKVRHHVSGKEDGGSEGGRWSAICLTVHL